MEKDLMTDNSESPSAFEGNVEELGANLFEGIYGTTLDAQASDEEIVETDVDDQVEEVIDEEEEVPVDDASDGDSAVEAEEADEGDEADPEEVHETDIDIISITELAEQVGKIEINGNEYTPAQLKSILGQEESAGTKVREASSKLKDLEAREENLAKQEQWLKDRNSAVAKSDQLAEMQAEARKINAHIQKARGEGDMYEVALYKDKLEQLTADYNQTAQQVQQVRQREEQESLLKAEAGLKQRGLDYLLSDNDQSKAWSEYASSKLSQQELRAALMSPAIAEAFEKARKYDTASGKTTRKLKSSAKTLKGGTGNKIGSKQSKQEQARKQRLRAGLGTESDTSKSALNIAKALLE